MAVVAGSLLVGAPTKPPLSTNACHSERSLRSEESLFDRSREIPRFARNDSFTVGATNVGAPTKNDGRHNARGGACTPLPISPRPVPKRNAIHGVLA